VELIRVFPLLGFMGAPMVAGLTMVLYKIGTNAFCAWASADYPTSAREENNEIIISEHPTVGNRNNNTREGLLSRLNAAATYSLIRSTSSCVSRSLVRS
jgi:hypothetical protein